MKRAIVTVGASASRLFGPYLERFKRTFKEYGGADYLKIWTKWPPGSPSHHDVHYAFKYHAVKEAFERNCTTILWLDSSCSAFAPLDPMWERIERDGHALVEDANALGKWSSDRSLSQFGVSRDEAMDIRLMCGTCFGLDLTREKSRDYLAKMLEMATRENFVGTHQSRLPGLTPYSHPRPGTEGAMVSDDERVSGHRSDEVYASLIARELGMATHAGVEFIGGCGNLNPRACIKSGYDLPNEPMAVGLGPDGLIDYGDRYDVD